MAKRSKQIVWHKKQQKFISPSVLKPHGSLKDPHEKPMSAAALDRKKVFLQNLTLKIRSAVRENPQS
jgi:hypothetical protein